jgi:WD40 repeat protein
LDNEIHVRPQSLENVGFCAHSRFLQVYDIRKQAEVSTLSGHTDTPTSITLSPNGSFILSPSLSSQTIIHDVRPFSPSPTRIHRVLSGAPAGFENTLLKGAWSKDDGGQRVAVGGADRTVTIWDVESSKILYKVRAYTFTSDRDSYLLLSCPAIRAQSLVLTSIPRNQLVSRSYPVICLRLIMPNLLVLTGGKDGTMLVGELEQGISI